MRRAALPLIIACLACAGGKSLHAGEVTEQFSVNFTRDEGFSNGLLIRQQGPDTGTWVGAGLKVNLAEEAVVWDTQRPNASWNRILLKQPIGLANKSWETATIKVALRLSDFPESFAGEDGNRVVAVALSSSPDPYEGENIRLDAALTENDDKLYLVPAAAGSSVTYERAGLFVRRLSELGRDNEIEITLHMTRPDAAANATFTIASSNLRAGAVETAQLTLPPALEGENLYLLLIFGDAGKIAPGKVLIDSLSYSVEGS